MEKLWQDLRYSARTLVKSPGFTVVAVLSLALGIGANTTIFSLISTLLLNPLPVRDVSELVALVTVDEKNPGVNRVSFPNYEDFRDQNQVFSGVASYSFPNPVSMIVDQEPEQVFAQLVTGNYFDVLGVEPALGRAFFPEEDETPGLNPVLVMNHGLWTRRFGGDPAILGNTLRLNGTAYTVVGIAPERFKGVNAIFGPDFWVPTMMHDQIMQAVLRDWFDDRRALFMNVAGRLKPGTSIVQADANVKTIASNLRAEYPKPNKGRSAKLVPLTEATIFGMRNIVVLGGTVLMTVVGLVLLIACSNVANLMLAKAATRRKEIAIRLSMGAARSRLVRQLLTESTLLALMGGTVGLLVAFWGRSLIWSIRFPVAQFKLDLQFDARVLLFTLVASLLTGLIFGLAPALQSSRADLVDALNEETRTAGRSKRRLSFRNALVVGQVALSIVSLIAAGLFLRSLASAHEIDPGFESHNLAVLILNPGQSGYDQPRVEQYFDQVLDRARDLPGVRLASWSSQLPLFGGFSRTVFIEGQEEKEEGGGILVVAPIVDVGYFDTFGVSILRGRDFTLADREDSVPVAIINETMAERFWPDQDPLGKRFRFYGNDYYREVVGIAETVKYVTLAEDPRACAYTPMRQNYSDSMVLYVRSEADPAAALAAVQHEVRDMDPEVPVTFPSTVREVMDQSLLGRKLAAALLGVMGILALALASVGLYGVMAHSVNQRNREIGLRMALGARQPEVLTLILKQSMTLVGIGLGIGLAVTLAVSRSIESLLYGVHPADPLTFASISVIMLAVALVASFFPAHRASRVDPLVALRYE